MGAWLFTMAGITIVFWTILTKGGNDPLGPKEKTILFLAVVCEIETAVIVRLIEWVKELRASGNPEYIRLIRKKESDIADKKDYYEDTILKLKMDLAAMQGKADINEQYLSHQVEKYESRDMTHVDEVNRKFVSPDGLSKQEKQARAYWLSTQGVDKRTIADRLKLSMTTLNGYISEGKKWCYSKYYDPELQTVKFADEYLDLVDTEGEEQ